MMTTAPTVPPIRSSGESITERGWTKRTRQSVVITVASACVAPAGNGSGPERTLPQPHDRFVAVEHAELIRGLQ